MCMIRYIRWRCEGDFMNNNIFEKYDVSRAIYSTNLKMTDLWHIMLSRNWNALQWRHNGRDSVSNHQPHDCLLNRLFRRRSKKTSKLSVTGLCVGNSPVTGEIPAQMASFAENVPIWWRHHGKYILFCAQYRQLYSCHSKKLGLWWQVIKFCVEKLV